MDDILKLQKKIVPEITELIQKRYSILKTIECYEPIGRRLLATKLCMGERVIRTEVEFLKEQKLIEINTPGMTITQEGKEVIDKLKDYIVNIKGLKEIQEFIKSKIGIKEVIIVPGDLDEDHTVMNELGKAAASYLRNVLKDGLTISITGGSTVKEVVEHIPKITSFKDIMIVPARGGMGRNVETQANTLVAKMASKLDANYKMLHVPDNLSPEGIYTITKEKDIKDVLDIIHQSDMLLYGIGIAEDMAYRRGLTEDKVQELKERGAVGEAFGSYFNMQGKVVYFTPTIGIKNYEINKISILIAVAGGKDKAKAIIAAERYNPNNVLITDEGAGREIFSILQGD